MRELRTQHRVREAGATREQLADSDALYFVQGGGNDVRIAGTLGSVSEASLFLDIAVNSIDSIVTGLINAGATNIAVLNSPDIGLLPVSTLAGVSAEATALSQAYNWGSARRSTFISRMRRASWRPKR